MYIYNNKAIFTGSNPLPKNQNRLIMSKRNPLIPKNQSRLIMSKRNPLITKSLVKRN